MKREAISFGRFSSAKQEEGDSLRRQRAAYERCCDRHKDRCEPSTRYGFGAFFGRGESGFSGRHLGKGGSLRALLDKLRSGEIDPKKTCVVVEAFDRLSRLEPDLAMQLISDIVRMGCPVVVDSPDLWLETADLGGHKFILIAAMLQLAHAESKQKSERLCEHWTAQRKRGGHGSSICPRWCRQEKGGKFVLIPEKAAVVRRIFREYTNGSGDVVIALGLNMDHIPTLHKKAKTWDKRAIQYIIKSRVVLGEYQPTTMVRADGKTKRVKEGQPVMMYPPVISEELFARAQGSALERRRLPKHERGVVNLFSGIMFDAVSGSVMYKKLTLSMGKAFYYLVPSECMRDNGSWASISYHLVEMAFVHFIRGLELRKVEDGSLQARIEAERSIVAKVNADLERISMEADIDSLIVLMRRLEATKKAAELRLAALEQEASRDGSEDLGRLQLLADQWDKAEEAGELEEFKEGLRNRIRSVVREIWIRIEAQTPRKKTVTLQVVLRDGTSRWLRLQTGKDGYVMPIDGEPGTERDLKNWE